MRLIGSLLVVLSLLLDASISRAQCTPPPTTIRAGTACSSMTTLLRRGHRNRAALPPESEGRRVQVGSTLSSTGATSSRPG